jgi:hypothetical protein
MRPRHAGSALAAALVLLAAWPVLAGPAPTDPPEPLTGRRDNLGRVVTSPLDDLNLRRIDIPEILVKATADPYDLTGLRNCGAVAAEVRRLDAVLGPDRDVRQTPENRSGVQKAGAAAVGAARVGAEVLIPYRGIARRVSGAAKHQAEVQEAVGAGAVRRGYLKGLGMRMNCAPPAAPAWFRPAPPPRPVKPAASRARR